MAKILLLETASDICSAAIAVDGEIIALEENSEGQQHAALLTVQVNACSKKSGIPLADLDAVAVSHGPGAYTSLRVGASVAKGICYALDKPLIAVDTLHALAWAARDWHRQSENSADPAVFVPALDARRQEIWTALYDENLQVIAGAQSLILENNLFEYFLRQGAKAGKQLCVIIAGNGSEKIRSGGISPNSIFFPKILCSASYLRELAAEKLQNADFQDVVYFEPFYMKHPNITSPKKALF